MLSIVIILFCWPTIAFAQQDYESLKLINSTNWGKWFDGALGFLYDSHGCLHFSPTDIYLLYRTVPAGIPLTVKPYKLKENDPPYPLEKLPYLNDKIGTVQELEKHRLMFKNYRTELVSYPSLNQLVIMVNAYPYARVTALAGPPYKYLMAYEVVKGKPIGWDFMLTTPTDPGTYQILRLTDHYLSSAYYKNTIVPFGAWLKKSDGKWHYEKNGKWHPAPDNVVADLARADDQRLYNYFDVNVDAKGRAVAARYAGHDFGRYVMLWTRDGKNHYPEMGYAAGELVYEQIVLVKDLVHLLTVPGADELDQVIKRNGNFQFYRTLADFRSSKGARVPARGDPAMYSYYKLFNGLELTERDRQLMDPRAVKAYREYVENRLPRHQRARWESLGLYSFVRFNSLVIDKQAGWYERVKEDWPKFQKLRAALRQDFDRMGVLSIENRQNLVENWLNERLELKQVSPPRQAKYVSDLSFASFFRPDDGSTLFSERERAIMIKKIQDAVKGAGAGLNLKIVDALNKYNLGVLLNEILGDLYKSHGCLHVSPRNALFLYDLLPVGAQMKVYKYSDHLSPEAVSAIPYLTDLINYAEDLAAMRQKFLVTAEVKVAVYPTSGDWLIYLKEQPFARLSIRGGPQERFYMLQGRAKDGKPIFEPTLAYPTTPGDYFIFRKVENYLSNLYRDQTVIPMGGTILWRPDKQKWTFRDVNGNWKELPASIAADLAQPADQREYTYYDQVKNASGEVLTVRWGSHPFGRYSLITTVDRKRMWPELIHSSGDLIMEERQLVNELIRILTAPHDQLDECVKYSQNFELYRACHLFVKDPDRSDLIQPRERAAYRLYFNLPLTAEELALLPADTVAAAKWLRGAPLSAAEQQTLISAGLAHRRSGNFRVDREKALGMRFDTYQFVVTIQKYAHHYEVLNRHWSELTGLRRALLSDFNDFVLKDAELFHNFMRELMLKRNALERLTQEGALRQLNGMLEQEQGGEQ